MREYGIKSPEAHKIKKAKPAHRPRVRCRKLILHVSENGLFARFENDTNFYPVRLLDDFVGSGLGETMPQVVQDIVYRYMYAYAKEISA